MGFGRTSVFAAGRASVGWFDPSRDHLCCRSLGPALIQTLAELLNVIPLLS
jgi:hypothetical protein